MRSFSSHASAKTVLLIFFVPLLSLIAACQWHSQSRNYNVILISIDTLRADHLSCYGYFRETSPTIDAFAENALQYLNAFAASPSTLPSHMSIFTSVLPTTHGLMYRGHFVPLSRKIKTLPEILRANGYDTYGYYESGLSREYGFGRGFISYKYRINSLVYRAVDLMKDTSSFLFIHYFDVHCSNLRTSKFVYDGPPEFRDRYTQSQLDHNPSDVFLSRVKLTDEELEQVIARYDGGILHVDSQLKALFKRLKEKGLFANSLIIITADHGESLGYKGMMDKHGWLYDVGLHVPLLIKLPQDFQCPGPKKGRVDQLVRTIDIMPTILDVLSIDPPPYIEGRSLLGVAEDRVAYSRLRNCYSLRTANSRLLFYGAPDFENKTDIEIYDVKNDPLESQNLYGKDDTRLSTLMPVAERLETKAVALKTEFQDEDLAPQKLDQKGIDELKALGYLQE